MEFLYAAKTSCAQQEASGSIKGEKGEAKAMQVVEVLVWDPFVRLFHWLLASTVLFDWATDEPR